VLSKKIPVYLINFINFLTSSMSISLKAKKIILLLGDIALFFGSLSILIYFRFPENFNRNFSLHFIPFSIILPIWLIAFYASSLYEYKILKNNINFLTNLAGTALISTLVSVFIFYFFPLLGITPKTNLFIFIAVFFSLEIIWREIFNLLINRHASENIILIGESQSAKEIEEFIRENPQFGYRLKIRLEDNNLKKHLENLEKNLSEQKIHLIIIPENIKKDLSFVKSIYKRLNLNLEVKSVSEFYEIIFQKVPLSEIKETWFLENLTRRRTVFEITKRFYDFSLALLLLIFLLPLYLLIIIFLKIFSRGPSIYSQKRIGKNEKEFILYKFRSMKVDAEADGQARWALPKDPRLTKIGAILRKTHLDELPQLLNILKGNLSFVGPRPERLEFIKELKELIPYYETRHLIKPGVTGWAQVNYRYGSSVEDAYEKLQYELFYIKNRSFALDLSIILKTLKTVFANPE